MIKTSFYNINSLEKLEAVKPAAPTDTAAVSFFETLKTVTQKESIIYVNTVTPFLPIVLSSQRQDVRLEVPDYLQNIFTSEALGPSPLALRDKALAAGLTVRQANNGSLEDLASLIDMGIPLLVPSRAHWLVVTGYKRDDSGKVSHVYSNDPNRSTTQLWTAADFEPKFGYFMAMTPHHNPDWSFQEAALKRYLPQGRLA